MTPANRRNSSTRRTKNSGVAARQLAAEGLLRIERDGAFANIVLSSLLDESGLEQRDKGFATELVYGCTRMRRSCDWLVDRFLPDPDRVDLTARTWLRLGAFQLAFLGTPPHAAVSATVEAAPRKISGLCNAVLRKVATSLPVEWPSEGVRLSQPDWIVTRLIEDLGIERATSVHTNCDPSFAEDKSLPRDSYLISYCDSEGEKFDIVQGLRSDIFDHYWDKYRDVRSMGWTEGTVNPKSWGYQTPKTKKRK